MEGIESISVCQARQTHWIKNRCLANHGCLSVRFHLERQPSPSRQFHLGKQAKLAVSVNCLNAPKVQRIPDSDGIRIPPAPAQPDPTNQGVNKATQAPQPVTVI